MRLIFADNIRLVEKMVIDEPRFIRALYRSEES